VNSCNRFKPIRSTAEVDFTTIRPCQPTVKSHINQVVLDSDWEGRTAAILDACIAVEYYARNDQLGLRIPYAYLESEHTYEPDFLVRLTSGITLLVEVKGYRFGHDEMVQAKHEAARKWLRAVNKWGELGTWDFLVVTDPNGLDAELQQRNAASGDADALLAG